MYCGNNKVALSSQNQLAEALMNLLRQKPFAEITVCELCRESGISRQTYYSLFNSKENVVMFTLQQRYCYTPHTQPSESESGLRVLCHEYSAYICANGEFIRMLVANNITYLLYDSISDALRECHCFLPNADAVSRKYAAAFFAGAITGIVKEYVKADCTMNAVELENVMCSLFSGVYF